MVISKLQEEINSSIKEFNSLKRELSNKKLKTTAEKRIKNLLRSSEYKNYLKKNPAALETIISAYGKYLLDKTKKEFKKIYT